MKCFVNHLTEAKIHFQGFCVQVLPEKEGGRGEPQKKYKREGRVGIEAILNLLGALAF